MRCPLESPPDYPGNDKLVDNVVHRVLSGSTVSGDHLLRNNVTGLIFRPLLKEAFAKGENLEDFLPKAVARWRHFRGKK